MPREAEVRPETVEHLFRSAVTHLLAGNADAAITSLDRCLALDPEFAPACSTRAGVHLREGRYEEAMRDIDRALALRPGHAGDLHNRAVVRTALEMYDGAIEDYEAVLAREPGSTGTRNNLAWVLATAKDPRVRDAARAVAYARDVVRTDRRPAWLDTLAAAYAECGDFERAVAVEEEAWSRSDPPNERFLLRLELYRRGRTLAGWRAEHDEARQEEGNRDPGRSPLR